MNTPDLTTALIKQLPAQLPPDFALNSVRKERGSTRAAADIEAEMQTPTGALRFVVEVKNADRIAPLREAAYQVKQFAQERNAIPFVASVFFGDRAKAVLKEQGVGFFDLAGNFYINQPGMYAEKVVDKNPYSRKPQLKNLFGPISSRIARALLVEPGREWQARELATATEVSLGQTYNILDGLVEEEFITKAADGKIKLQQPAALLKAWEQVYPSYQVQRYSFFSYERSYDDRIAAVLDKTKETPFAFGMFTGAGFIAPYIRGLSKAQLYVHSKEDVEQLQTALNLQPVGNGANIELFVPYDKGVFYKQQTVRDTNLGDIPVVSNVQLYMDLFNNPARGEEQAEHLRERKLEY